MSTAKEDSESFDFKTKKNMSKGIKCKKCNVAMFVCDTITHENLIERYRRCRICGSTRKTYEE